MDGGSIPPISTAAVVDEKARLPRNHAGAGPFVMCARVR